MNVYVHIALNCAIFFTKTFETRWWLKFQCQCSMHFSENMNVWELIFTLCTAEFFWKCSGLFWKTVLTACINTMQSCGLEMFWVILWRQCLLLVQTLCRAEVRKYSELFQTDRVSACINIACSWIHLGIFWFTLCRECLLLL
jgi:hypothetical protein